MSKLIPAAIAAALLVCAPPASAKTGKCGAGVVAKGTTCGVAKDVVNDATWLNSGVWKLYTRVNEGTRQFRCSYKRQRRYKFLRRMVCKSAHRIVTAYVGGEINDDGVVARECSIVADRRGYLRLSCHNVEYGDAVIVRVLGLSPHNSEKPLTPEEEAQSYKATWRLENVPAAPSADCPDPSRATTDPAYAREHVNCFYVDAVTDVPNAATAQVVAKQIRAGAFEWGDAIPTNALIRYPGGGLTVPVPR